MTPQGTCAYCGETDGVSPRFALCPPCWARLPGEIMDRVVDCRRHGLDSERFINSVEGACKYLVWCDEDEEE